MAFISMIFAGFFLLFAAMGLLGLLLLVIAFFWGRKRRREARSTLPQTVMTVIGIALLVPICLSLLLIKGAQLHHELQRHHISYSYTDTSER